MGEINFQTIKYTLINTACHGNLEVEHLVSINEQGEEREKEKSVRFSEKVSELGIQDK